MRISDLKKSAPTIAALDVLQRIYDISDGTSGIILRKKESALKIYLYDHDEVIRAARRVTADLSERSQNSAKGHADIPQSEPASNSEEFASGNHAAEIPS